MMKYRNYPFPPPTSRYRPPMTHRARQQNFAVQLPPQEPRTWTIAIRYLWRTGDPSSVEVVARRRGVELEKMILIEKKLVRCV